MCNLYQMTPKGAAERAIAEAGFLLSGDDWAPVTVGPFGAGAFLVPRAAGELVSNFTALTCNCDDHPMLARLHKPDPKLPADQQDKRSLIHIDASNWQQWLHGTADEALQLIRPQPAEVFDQADAQRTDAALESGQGGLF